MKVIIANCPACGGKYDGEITAGLMTCSYCGSKFALDDDERSLLELSGDSSTDDSGDGEYYEEELPLVDEFTREACREFLSNVNESEFERANNVIRGLSIGDADEIFLIHDDTLFNSGKNGFAITDYGFYCREIMDSSSHFMIWGDFASSGEPYIEDSLIKVDDVSLAYYTGDSDVRHELLKLYRKLHDYAIKFDWV